MTQRARRVPRAAQPLHGQELSDELFRRNERRDDGKIMVFGEFVLEALSGDL